MAENTDPASMTFTPMLEPPEGAPAAGAPLIFSVKGSAVHVGDGPAGPGDADVYLGRLGDVDCWAVDLDGDEEPDVMVTPLLALHAAVSEQEWTVAGRAVQLLEWRRTHRFCGRCGAATEEVPGERAMRCPDCGLLAFPHPLMIGFRAEWAGGDIEVDGVEIAEAAWYDVDDLPPIPPRLSIARVLIDEWIAAR